LRNALNHVLPLPRNRPQGASDGRAARAVRRQGRRSASLSVWCLALKRILRVTGLHRLFRKRRCSNEWEIVEGIPMFLAAREDIARAELRATIEALLASCGALPNTALRSALNHQPHEVLRSRSQPRLPKTSDGWEAAQLKIDERESLQVNVQRAEARRHADEGKP